MKFKLIPLITAFAVFSGIFCTAAENNPVYPEKLNLESAIEYALKNHTAVIAARSDVAQNEAKEDEAFDLYAKNRYNSFANSYATYELSLVKKGVPYLAAKTSLEIAKETLKLTEYSTRMGVETGYYMYMNNLGRIKITEASLATATERYNTAVTQLSLGLVSEYEVMVAENTLARAKATHDSAQRSLELSLAQLKAAVGLPVSAETTFTPIIMTLPAVPEITLEEAIAEAKKNNLAIKAARLQKELAEATFSAANAWYSPNTYTYKNARTALDFANASLTKALAEAEMKVYNAYNEMQNQISDAEITKKSVTLTEKTYEINQKQYDLGLIAKLDLDESWQETENVKLSAAGVDMLVYTAIKSFEMSYLY